MRRNSVMVLVLGLLGLTNLGQASTYNETFDERFSQDQKDFLYYSIQKAYTGLFADRRVYNCIYKVPRYEPVDDDTVTQFHGENWLRTGKFFLAQWGVFSAFVSNGDVLPDIHINYYSDPDTFAGGYANYGKVHTSASDGKLHWHGKFEVSINAAKLTGTQTYETWGALIAHEMLHNLMHKHPSPKDVGLEAAYSKDYLINAAQSCVATYGSSYSDFPQQRCGGRVPN